MTDSALVDARFQQSGVFREGKETAERLMDSMDLERERGITIAAKNCSIVWHGIKISILNTPGTPTSAARWSRPSPWLTVPFCW